ncbi:DUF1493 family protein [Komagataeibacter kakiaceti]|uniref:DUF1493 family protein n=1 Tax=Komagataeibacter kakiaceti TaxID=943261 RepID=UPI0009FCB9E7|nr:DUF1493 family protein [Komagataeibacter kakiaceti]
MHTLSDDFKSFLISEERLSEPELQLSTRIVEDLSLDGYDAHCLMVSYIDTFHINTGDFDFCRYFRHETPPFLVFLIIPDLLFRLFRLLVWQFLLGKPAPEPTTVPLTLAMLQQAIDDGRWDSARLESLAGTEVYPPPPQKTGWFARIRNGK